MPHTSGQVPNPLPSGLTIPSPSITGTVTGGARLFHSSAVPVVAPANDTNENTLVTVALPALGANDSIIVETVASGTSSANDKIMRVKIGAVTFSSILFTTGTPNRIQTDIHNNNATNVQHIDIFNNSPAALAFTVGTAAADLSGATSLLITAQKETGTETFTLLKSRVWLLRGGLG